MASSKWDQVSKNQVVDAAADGNLEILLSLYKEHGFEPNIMDESGLTPLVRASTAGKVDIIRALLRVSASEQCAFPDMLLALAAACEGGFLDVVELLLANIDSDLLKAPQAAKLEPLDADPPLVCASRGCQVAIVLYLLDVVGVPVDCKRSANRYQASYGGGVWDEPTSLIVASERGFLEVVRILLDHGANINAQTMHGETALGRAKRARHNGVVDLLLLWGADSQLGTTKKKMQEFSLLGKQLEKGPDLERVRGKITKD